jgi:hypothetical protein
MFTDVSPMEAAKSISPGLVCQKRDLHHLTKSPLKQSTFDSGCRSCLYTWNDEGGKKAFWH